MSRFSVKCILVFACILSIPVILNIWMGMKMFDQYRGDKVLADRALASQMCGRLVAGDNTAFKAAKEMESFGEISDETYVNMTRNCTKFIINRGYAMQPLSEEESNFPLAYSILMYKDASQAERLLRAIYFPQNYYIIHVDPKAKQVVKDAARGIANCFPNVFEAKKPVSVSWGTMSLLQAELTCMRQLLPYKKWKYFINLTGQEFPLWSNRDIVRTLKAFKGANNIEGKFNLESHQRRYKYVYNGTVKTDQVKEPPPFNLTLVKGSIHILGSRRFVEFALTDNRSLGLLDWLNDTLIPDESFFSTVNYSPELRAPGGFLGLPDANETTNPFLVRYVKWLKTPNNPESPACRGKYVREVCIHGVESLHDLAQRKELFVNKFHKDYQPFALDCMEELLKNRTVWSKSQNYTFESDYLSNLSFVLNHG